MNETLLSKLTRLLVDESIYRVEINLKCKTHDGMIYTLLSHEHNREVGTEAAIVPFPDRVHTSTVEELLHIMGIVEKGDGYYFSLEEMVAVKHTEIVRIWAELGDLYYDEMPQHG